jgi:hypothetical protein
MISNEFLKGYACCLCSLISITKKVDKNVQELYMANLGGLSIPELRKKGIDDFDLYILKEYWKQLNA